MSIVGWRTSVSCATIPCRCRILILIHQTVRHVCSLTQETWSVIFTSIVPPHCSLREHPQRPPLVWGFDVSKQVVGMGAAHASGLIIAILVHHTSANAASECSWYFVAYTFDTTLGVFLTLAIHKLVLKYIQSTYTAHATQKYLGVAAPREHGATQGGVEAEVGVEGSWAVAITECGRYGDPPSFKRWTYQAAEWSACVVAARALCGAFVVLLSRVLVNVASALDSLFSNRPTLLLFVVMVCCPLLMNAAQLLVQDAYLKWKGRGGGGGPGWGAPELEEDGVLLQETQPVLDV